MAVTKNELESEIAKVMKRLDKIDQKLDKLESHMGPIMGWLKALQKLL